MTTMARRALAALTCAAALVALPARLQAQSPAVAEGRTAADLLSAWVEAFNSRDPRRIVALYAPTAVLWGTTATSMATTPDQIWDYFKNAGQRPATRVTIESNLARAFGDIAVISGTYTFADVTSGVRSNVRPARYTFVLQRTGGRWLIVEHHSSRVPQP